ncbi:TLE member 5 [Entophlyctis sp. JEL0112]|nr:TLE member 5 [Entophlyctis sp. JEL0112]
MAVGVAGSDACLLHWLIPIHLLRRISVTNSKRPFGTALIDILFDVSQAVMAVRAMLSIHRRASIESAVFGARMRTIQAVKNTTDDRTRGSSVLAFASACATGGILLPHTVEHIKDVTYATKSEVEAAGGVSALPFLQLDILRRKTGHAGRPVMIYIHGGAWLFGDKRLPTLPICRHFASSANWVVLNVNYRLAPQARLFDMLVDIKRIIRWARQNSHIHGGNPEFIAISGGSAGGHLCSLAALTGGWKQFQPGFEQVDTHLQACLPIYPAVGYVWANLSWSRWFLESIVKMTDKESILRFSMGVKKWCDPMSLLNEIPVSERQQKLPPFFIVQGTYDNVVDPALVRAFVTELSRENAVAVGYLEVPGAHHSFDIAIGPTLMQVLWSCEQAMDSIYEGWVVYTAGDDTKVVLSDEGEASEATL